MNLYYIAACWLGALNYHPPSGPTEVQRCGTASRAPKVVSAMQLCEAP